MATTSVNEGSAVGKQSSMRWRLLRKLLGQKTALLGFVICVTLGLSALFAPFITPYDPLKLNMRERLETPSAAHWLGTDELGRDVLTRLIYGARISITVGAISILVAISIGVPLGVTSAYYGGVVDTWIMRTMDALAAFPAILLALAIVSVLGPNIRNPMIAIGIVYLPAFSRVARSSVLTVQENDFVEAGRAAGASNFRIMFLIILPNAFAPILVLASLGFASAIIIESALSFLGLGAQAPSPSWGLMLNQGRQFMTQTIWYSVSSGFAIFITVLGLNLIGDGLRDVLDPRLRGR